MMSRNDTDIFAELEARGLVHSYSQGLPEELGREALTVYAGFDPTADSLHVGHLFPLLGLARLQRAGHRPIALVGGGTGMIGDPSGKSEERQLLTRERVEQNVEHIREQLGHFLDFSGENAALLIDNHDWLGSLGLLDFLRDVGKHFTLNYMLAKDSVSRRLEQEDGLSITEFSYMLLQAYDYLVLSDRLGTSLQIGGSDQWGNITAGIELVRRTRARSVHGLVFPLVTTSSGTKFGKTEAGTVWLDPARTSPFRFYQFWLHTDDRDLESYLKGFTFLSLPQIEQLLAEHAENPGARRAQRTLARELTRMVHGEEQLERAERATGVLFGSAPAQSLPAIELLEVFADVPSIEISRTRLEGDGLPIVELLVEAGVASSRGEARRLTAGGGVYLNGERLESVDLSLTPADAIDEGVFILRKGRRQNFLVRIV